jgi:hypothetical protein
MLRRALKRFEKYPDRYFGFDLGEHRRELETWRERVEAGAVEGPALADLPKWRFGTEA